MPNTTYFDNLINRLFFGAVGSPYTAPATLYVALSSTAPSQTKGASGPFWNFTEPAMQSQLTVASGTSPTTALSVQATDAALLNAASLTLDDGAGGHANAGIIASGAQGVNTTALAVSSFTPNFNYPIGSTIRDTVNGYARVAVANNTTNWGAMTSPPATGDGVADLVAITFPAPTGPWGTLAYFGIFDAKGGGNLLCYGSLTNAQTIGAGDTASFAIQALTVQLN